MAPELIPHCIAVEPLLVAERDRYRALEAESTDYICSLVCLFAMRYFSLIGNLADCIHLAEDLCRAVGIVCISTVGLSRLNLTQHTISTLVVILNQELAMFGSRSS